MAKEKEAAPKTQTYILRQGQEHNGFKDGGRHLFKGGDEVELSDRQYNAFKDKFDSKAELAARARVANGGNVSREEALAALGLTEEQVAAIVASEETNKKPDGDEDKGEPITIEPAPDEAKKVQPGGGTNTGGKSQSEMAKDAEAKPGTAGAAAKK